MSKMLKSSSGIGAATLASRVLGLVREIFFAAFMGTTETAAAFYFAFNIPNLLRRLLGEGALTAAFIPIFKAKEKIEGEGPMWQAANAVISGLLVITPAIAIAAMLVLSGMIKLGSWDEGTLLMFRLMRLMFPYLIMVCLSAIFMGILNARGHFFIPALSPVILNLVMIASVWLLAPRFGTQLHTQVFALAFGVLAAGVAQSLFQLPTMYREGFRYNWVSPWRNPTTREVVVKMIPGAIGVAAFQINVTVTQALAFGKNKVIVAEFYNAVRLMELPQGVFGLSLATFLLPTLAGLAVEKNWGHFRATLRQGINYLVYINLLAAVFLFTLAEPIIRLLFERGKFNATSTDHVSFALACLAPGLVCFSLVNILARAFYAMQDIQTPMRVSVFCLVLNLILTAFLLFLTPLGAGALGLANTLTSTCNFALLLYALRRKLKTLEMSETLRLLPRLLAAAAVAGVVAWAQRVYWTKLFGHNSFPMKVGEVFLPMIEATLVYFLLSLWWKIPVAAEIVDFLRSRTKAPTPVCPT